MEYSDHHSYTPAEVRCLAQQAKVLLTTEKDAVNLCEGAASLLGDTKLLWLKIDLEITNEAALLALCDRL